MLFVCVYMCVVCLCSRVVSLHLDVFHLHVCAMQGSMVCLCAVCMSAHYGRKGRGDFTRHRWQQLMLIVITWDSYV